MSKKDKEIRSLKLQLKLQKAQMVLYTMEIGALKISNAFLKSKALVCETMVKDLINGDKDDGSTNN